MNITTELMKAAILRLCLESPRADVNCLVDHNNDDQVEFISPRGGYVIICAACIAELLPPGVMIFLQPEDAADIRTALGEYQKDRINAVRDDVIDQLDAAIFASFEEDDEAGEDHGPSE